MPEESGNTVPTKKSGEDEDSSKSFDIEDLDLSDLTDPNGLLLTTDSTLLLQAQRSSNLTGRLWTEEEVDFDYDYLIVDLSVFIESGEQKEEHSYAFNNVQLLARNLKQFLKKGGVVVVLFGEQQAFYDEKRRAIPSNHWIGELRTIRLNSIEGIHSIQSTVPPGPVNDYLEFVDTCEYEIEFFDESLSDEILATDRRSGTPVAVATEKYQDKAGFEQTFDGTLLMLPRPNHVNAAADEIIQALQGIGEEYQPNTQPRSQSKLVDFQNGDSNSGNKLDLDEKLLDKAVPALERGDPEDAVRTAGIILDDRVDDVVPDSVSDGRDGTDLMAAAFGPDGGEIQIAEHNSEQAGIMFLARGLMQAFRNPFSHRTREEGRGKYLDNITEQDAKTAILLSDFLIRKMEDADSQQ